MRKEPITLSQSVFTLVLFIFGSSVVVGVSGEAKQDAWMSLLIASAMMIPLLLMYARIMRLFPETDLFDILEILFGKIFGKVFILLITWYALHLCSLVLRNFTEFLQIVVFPETPQLPMMFALIFVTAYLAGSGENILGKWSMIMFPIVSLTVLVTIAMAVTDLDFTHLEPFFAQGLPKILSGAYQILTFPFAETVLFLGIAGAVKKEISPYKIYGFAILVGSFILVMVILRNIMILGTPMISASYFPSYTTARILHIGDFLSRIESSITMNFLLSGVVKITLCLIVAAKGISKIFGIEDYKRMIMPTSMLVVALCAIVYNSAMEMFGFLVYYQIYAIPFQMFIPAVVWITAEIRHKKQMKKRAAA
jgi:spore germination protein KB